MSSKTIVLDARVYARLAAAKREGESFSKVIDRLLAEVGAAYTGLDIVQRLRGIPALSPAETEVFLGVVEEDRAGERWESRDLR